MIQKSEFSGNLLHTYILQRYMVSTTSFEPHRLTPKLATQKVAGNAAHAADNLVGSISGKIAMIFFYHSGSPQSSYLLY